MRARERARRAPTKSSPRDRGAVHGPNGLFLSPVRVWPIRLSHRCAGQTLLKISTTITAKVVIQSASTRRCGARTPLGSTRCDKRGICAIARPNPRCPVTSPHTLPPLPPLSLRAPSRTLPHASHGTTSPHSTTHFTGSPPSSMNDELTNSGAKHFVLRGHRHIGHSMLLLLLFSPLAHPLVQAAPRTATRQLLTTVETSSAQPTTISGARRHALALPRLARHSPHPRHSSPTPHPHPRPR